MPESDVDLHEALAERFAYNQGKDRPHIHLTIGREPYGIDDEMFLLDSDFQFFERDLAAVGPRPPKRMLERAEHNDAARAEALKYKKKSRSSKVRPMGDMTDLF